MFDCLLFFDLLCLIVLNCFVLFCFARFCLVLPSFVFVCRFVFVGLFVCLSVCLSVYLSVCLFGRLSVFFLSLFVCLSVCCSLTPSHANEAMEFRPKENVDAHSCTCFVETVDQAVLLRCFPALPFDLTFMVFQIDLNI